MLNTTTDVAQGWRAAFSRQRGTTMNSRHTVAPTPTKGEQQAQHALRYLDTTRAYMWGRSHAEAPRIEWKGVATYHARESIERAQHNLAHIWRGRPKQ